MKTQRDEKILVHVSGPLKATVRSLAEAEGRSESDYVRRLLIEHAEARLIAPDGQEAAA